MMCSFKLGKPFLVTLEWVDTVRFVSYCPVVRGEPEKSHNAGLGEVFQLTLSENQ